MASLKLIALLMFLSISLVHTLGVEDSLEGLENVALHKPATQITQHFKAAAGRSVDGNRNSHFFKGKSCSHTRKHMEPWWRVDLEQRYKVHAVTITNRGDSSYAWKRLRNFSVYVDNILRGRDRHETEDRLEGPPGIHKCIANVESIGKGATVTYKCDRPLVGRYVTLAIEAENLDDGQLNFCEMEVMADPQPIECIESEDDCAMAPERIWAVCGDCYKFITCVNAERHTMNTCPNKPKDLYFDVIVMYCVQKKYAKNPCKKYDDRKDRKGDSGSMDED